MKKKLSILLASALIVIGVCGSYLIVGADENVTQEKLQSDPIVSSQLENEQNGEALEEVPGEVLVMFEDASELTVKEQQKVENIEEGDALTKQIEVEQTWDFGEDGAKLALASSDSLDNKEMIEKLENKNIVATAAPNYKRSISSTSYSNDPGSKFQWMLSGDEEGNGISVNSIWNGTPACKGSDELVVAVIDTGVDYTNSDLRGQMWKNQNQPKLAGTYGFDFANGDDDPIDDNGHGSHCAGIIGAEGDNSIGISGVNKEVKIMALKVLDAEGYGDDAGIISAFNYVYKAMKLGTNVVAINCSFGGTGYNEIMLKVINMVGQQGAVTVAAAGNDGEEIVGNDKEILIYPACFDSPYVITVGAIREDGEKASFSNYGTEWVDIAAPGTNILSTVSYTNYLPALHTEGGDTLNNMYLDGSDASAISEDSELGAVSTQSTGGYIDNKDALKLKFQPVSDGDRDYQYAVIEYTVPEDYEQGDQIRSSLMERTDGREYSIEGFFEIKAGYIGMLDVPKSALDPESEDYILDTSFDSIYEVNDMPLDTVSGTMDYWRRLSTVAEGASAGQERAILIMAQCQNGNFDAYIDDFGISNPSRDSDFDKLDFYSGTSMATPCVTGAVALLAAANDDESYSPEKAISDILSSVDDNKILPVKTDGTLDFSKKQAGYWLGINEVTVQPNDNTITITGGDFTADNLCVSITKRGENSATDVTNFITQEADKIVFEDTEGWTNNYVNITITGSKNSKNKTTTREDVYMINGKEKFTEADDISTGYGEIPALATDGKNIYYCSNEDDAIEMVDTTTGDCTILATLYADQAKKIFSNYAEEEDANYDFRFGDDIALLDGKLYAIGTMCEVGGSGYYDDSASKDNNENRKGISYISDEKNEDTEDDDDDDFDQEIIGNNEGVAYSAEYALLSIDITSDEPSIEEMPLPNSLAQVVDFKLAAYNGTLYILGGYDYDKYRSRVSNYVYYYDDEDEEWGLDGNMPEARAGGKVIQSGDKLIYTLGYGESTKLKADGSADAPKNMIFDGDDWEVSDAELVPYSYTSVARGDTKYANFTGNVGICKQGLVYIGMPAVDYGDTFIYDAAADEYKGTAYNYSQGTEDVAIASAIAVDKDLYAYTAEDTWLKASNAVDSGLISIKASKLTGGKISGTGTYMPGESYTIKAIANNGYYAKSLSLEGAKSAKTTSKGLYISGRALKSGNVNASFAKLTIKVSKTKASVTAGKTYKLGASITPSAASAQWTLKYKSSNTKYATVSTKGVVTTKKAGKGKTVKITAYAGSTSVAKTVTLTIK